MSLSQKEYNRRKFVKLHKKWINCKRCSLCKTRKNVIVGHGNLAAKFVIIGRNPGEEEDINGRPFIGKSGKLLDEVLKKYELDRDDFYVTNVLGCYTPNNREPRYSEIKACSVRLRKILNILDPKLIICLGDVAIRSQFDSFSKSITTASAKGIYRKDRPPRVSKKRYICCTWHPSAILRNPRWKKDWFKDWKKIAELILKIKEEYK